MKINSKQGLAPVAAIIIALIVIAGGGYGVKKAADSRSEKKAKEKAEQAEMMQKEQEEKEAKEKEEMMSRVIHVKLSEQNKSGQSGEATITQIGTSTVKVIVSITGKPSGMVQPAHIHLGACPTPGTVKYPLTSVEKGASQTEIQNLTLDDLLSGLPLAINVHKSAADIKTYTSCGDVKAENVMSGDEKMEGKDMQRGDKMPEKMKDGAKDMKKDGDKISDQGAAAITALSHGTTVTYGADGFTPKSVTIKKGAAVTWKNASGERMWIGSNEHPTHTLYDGTSLKQHCATGAAAAFDQCQSGESYSVTFTKTGSFDYHNHAHTNDGGTVIVTE